MILFFHIMLGKWRDFERGNLLTYFLFFCPCEGDIKFVVRFSFLFRFLNYFLFTVLQEAVVAEWLRRLTRNQIPSGSAGSSPADRVGIYIFLFYLQNYRKCRLHKSQWNFCTDFHLEHDLLLHCEICIILKKKNYVIFKTEGK